MAWQDFWIDPQKVQDEDGAWNAVGNASWNTASGYASPVDYLVKTRGLPAWMASFVDRARDETDAYNRGTTGTLDAAGFVLPNAYGGQRGTGNGKFDLGWIPDDNGDFPQEAAFRAALQQQLAGQGSGFAMPLADVQKGYQNSNIPGAGYSFDQYLQKQYQNPQIVDVPGVGQVVTAGGVNTFDWGLSNDKGFLDSLVKEIIPAGLTMYGAMTGIGGLSDLLINGAGSVAGALGDTVTGVDSLADFNSLAPASYTDLGGTLATAGTPATALLDPSLITSPVVPVSTGGVQGVGSGYGIGAPTGMADLVPPSLGGTGVDFAGSVGIGAPTGLESALPPSLGGTGVDFSAGALNAGGTVIPAATGAAVGSGLGNVVTMPNPGAPAATASEIAGTTAPAATGNSLSQYLQGLGVPAGLADLITPQSIGAIGSSLLGVLGSRDQANAYRDTANQFLNMGAPYRDRLASLYANPESYTTGPEMQGVMKAFNQSLSAQYGNPYMSPTATAQSVAYGLGALGKEKDRLAGYGGLGFNPARMAGLSAQGNSNSGTYNALGSGLAELTRPPNTMASTMEELLRAQTRRLNSGMGL